MTESPTPDPASNTTAIPLGANAVRKTGGVPVRRGSGWRIAWIAVATVAVAVRVWNALAGAALWGDDAWGHVSYMLFLDAFAGVPWADQGWSYFHPPFHYALGWILAQSGSADVLIRGLSLLSGAASLGVAALAADVARRALGTRAARSAWRASTASRQRVRRRSPRY